MTARDLLLVLLATFGAIALPATPAHALLVKVSINFGPTITGPADGTLIVTANPGDLLPVTWALGTDVGMDRYRGFISGVVTTEISRDGGSALELIGQGFDPLGNAKSASAADFVLFIIRSRAITYTRSSRRGVRGTWRAGSRRSPRALRGP